MVDELLQDSFLKRISGQFFQMLHEERAHVAPELAQQMVRYWTRFAATGNPNGGSDPAWAPYTSAAADLIAQFDVGSNAQANVTMIRGLKDGICSFWFNTTIPASAIWG